MTIDPRRKFALEPADLGQVVRDCLPAAAGGVARGDRHRGFLDTRRQRARESQADRASPVATRAQRSRRHARRRQALADLLDMVESKRVGVPAGRWVRLRVRDNGRGMEPSLLEHAFEPFVSTKVPRVWRGPRPGGRVRHRSSTRWRHRRRIAPRQGFDLLHLSAKRWPARHGGQAFARHARR
jgi:hypothetical protein